jgi:V8-like Glu-specific endopeptidase
MAKELDQQMHEEAVSEGGHLVESEFGTLFTDFDSGIEMLPATAFFPNIAGDASSNVNEITSESEEAIDAYYASYDEPRIIKSKSDLESIIGPDDRVRINPTTSFPWRAICSLRIRTKTGKNFIGTGWLISPRTVITAGHCVYMHNEGGWAQSIEVIPGRNGALRPYGSGISSSFRSVTGWTTSKNRNFDYGAIILPNTYRPGATTGFFGFANLGDSSILAKTLNLSGYPGDKGGDTQWFHARRPLSLTPRTINYDIDTFGGQSGSPVWYLENGNRYSVGIHTNGGASNSATRIVSDVFANLQSWKALGA